MGGFSSVLDLTRCTGDCQRGSGGIAGCILLGSVV